MEKVCAANGIFHLRYTPHAAHRVPLALSPWPYAGRINLLFLIFASPGRELPGFFAWGTFPALYSLMHLSDPSDKLRQ
jgi:hypothetical protein